MIKATKDDEKVCLYTGAQNSKKSEGTRHVSNYVGEHLSYPPSIDL